MTALRHPISDVVAKCLKDYVDTLRSAGQKPRLLVPGLTRSFEREIHENLLNKSVKSFLITLPSGQQGSRSEITVEGMTSVRKDSFVFIVPFSAMATLPESILGSGGVIRSLAFPADWPWDDSGELSFNLVVMPELLDEWGVTDQQERDTLTELVSVLIKDLKNFNRRREVLFDEFLNGFVPSSSSSIAEEFLKHCGLPLSEAFKDTGEFIERVNRLQKQLLGRIKRGVDVRQEAKEAVRDFFSEVTDAEREQLLSVTHAFLDGLISASRSLDGVLSLEGGFRCASIADQDASKILTLEKLEKIFEVQDKTNASLSVTNMATDCGFVGGSGTNSVLSRHSSIISFEVNYDTGLKDLTGVEAKITISRSVKELASVAVPTHKGVGKLDLNTAGIENYAKSVSLSVQLRVDGEIKASERVRVELFGEKRPFIICLGDTLRNVPVGGDDPQIDVAQPNHVYVGAFGEKNGVEVFVDDQPCAVVKEKSCWRTKVAVDPLHAPSGSADVRVHAANQASTSFVLRLTTTERGAFTIYEEAVLQIARNKKSKLEKIHQIFSLANPVYYDTLGGATQSRQRLARLAKVFDDLEHGHLPIITDSLVNSGDVSTTPKQSTLAKWFDDDIISSKFPDLSTDAIEENLSGALSKYINTRQQIIQGITSRVVEVPTDVVHPPYAYSPVYIEPDSVKTADLIVEYLAAYYDLLGLTKSSMRWSSRFLVASLDCAVSSDFQERKWGVRLMGPWHPLTLARRFLLEKTVFSFAEQYVLKKKSQQVNGLINLLDSLVPSRWLPNQERSLKRGVLVPSTDAGWLVSVTLSPDTDSITLTADHLERHFGLRLKGYQARSSDTVRDTVNQFVAVNSSARRVDLGFAGEYQLADVGSSLVGMLKKKEKKDLHLALPGGVHARVRDKNWDADVISDILQAPEESLGNLFIYQNTTDSQKVDIEFLGATRRISFTRPDSEVLEANARGRNVAALLSVESRDVVNVESGGWVGQVGCNEQSVRMSDDIGTSMIAAAAAAQQLITDNKFVMSSPLELSSKLDGAAWIHAPGNEVDPALIKHFVVDAKGTKARMLWDYRINCGASDSSAYFIFSKPSEQMTQAIKSLLPDGVDSAQSILKEMAGLGVALIGESERSSNKAKGCVGLVGAVRVLDHMLGLRNQATGIVIPADAFNKILGQDLEHPDSLTRKMTDLMLVRFWHAHNDSKIFVSAVGVEAKYITNTRESAWVTGALGQAKETFWRLKWLVKQSAETAALPIRSALATIFSFGLRMQSVVDNKESREIERQILLALANGELVWADPVRSSLLVMSQPEASKSASKEVHDDQLVVTLSLKDWPSPKSESKDIKGVRKEILRMFPALPKCSVQEHSDQIPNSTDTAQVVQVVVDSESNPSKKALDNEEVLLSNPVSSETSGHNKEPSQEHATQDDSFFPAKEYPKKPNASSRAGKLTSQQLEDQYLKLMDIFNELDIDVSEVHGDYRAKETPATFKYRVKPNISSRKKVMSRDTEDSLHYALCLGRDQVLDIYQDEGEVVIDVPKKLEERYFVDSIALLKLWESKRDVLDVPLGVDQDGEVVSVNFSSCAHLLIAGQTGSGKSKAIEAIICNAATLYDANQLKFVLVDGKGGVELNKFASLPHCFYGVGRNGAEGVDRLSQAVDEMKRRWELFRESEVTNIAEYNSRHSEPGDWLPWWLVVLDEYADLRSSKETGDRLEDLVKRLGTAARAAGIHVIVSTQKPVVEVVTTTLKENLPARLAFRVSDGGGSRVILDDMGAEKLVGKGDGILKDQEGKRRFQCAMVEDDVLKNM